MLDEFKQFLLRGNIIDLAVAVVIGAAFTSIVNALVADLITPLIAAIGGQPDFSSLSFTINNSKFMYGQFLNAMVSFIIIASVVFFLLVKPINKLTALSNRGAKPVEPTSKTCEECLSEVPINAIRCKHCTSKLPPKK